ncbi:recombinase family protein [Rhodococcus erythropolis]|uniref:Putative recombinase n=1 Tax=Rhodococcus erythropolis (strain PR4 / NBRC 100887) TaxID=234621 RepID=C0ZW65_RHOE4|nr:recombinase family protein [Rhodococcus erythropolis]BAH32600.1 putative recombinase [Rhodococcus erythropolis PR4]
MRAAIYTRISVDQTGEGLGVERQLSDCDKLAESLNWTVVQRYSDNDVSAFSGKLRPGYETLLTAMQAGEVDALIAWHSDRLHRSPIELERFIEIADEAGVEIRTVHGGTLDLSTSAGRMVARILGSVARQESEHSSERRKRANDQKAASGAWQASRRPFGYTLAGEPLEPEAGAIKAAVADVLAGKSIRQVAREWNKQGLRTTHGGTLWSATSVRRVLKNPRYAALRVHRGVVVGEGIWEPLIEPDAHYGLLAYVSDPARAQKVSFERKWQGSGVYACGVCGSKLIVHVSEKKRAYKCPQNHVRRQGEALDAFVDAVTLARLSESDVRLSVESPGVDVSTLQIGRDTLQGRLDQLAAMFAEGAIDASQLRRGSEDLREQLAQVDAELGAARQGSPLVDLVLAGEALGERWAELSADMRGKVVEALMSVTVIRSPKGLRRFDPEYINIEWNV